MQKHFMSFLNKEDTKTSLQAFSSNPFMSMPKADIDDASAKDSFNTFLSKAKETN